MPDPNIQKSPHVVIFPISFPLLFVAEKCNLSGPRHHFRVILFSSHEKVETNESLDIVGYRKSIVFRVQYWSNQVRYLTFCCICLRVFI